MQSHKGNVLFIDAVHTNMWTELMAMDYVCMDCTHMNLEQLELMLPNAKGIVIRSRFTMNEEFLSSATNLEWIARSGVGMENIDEAYCQSKGISAFNAAGGNADAVAEHVIGMLLSLFNKLNSADREIRLGQWRREANRGLELGARTFGIVGYGHTGKALAKCLSGFGCRVLAYDKYVPANDGNAESVTLEQLQAKADVISFHVPLTEETQHYLNDAFIHQIAQPFYLINASRGPVASTAAIAKGIENGKLLGVCLDVLEEEGKDFQLGQANNEAYNYLLDSDRILLSPHVAGWTVESYEKLAQVLLDKIGQLA